MSGSTTIRTYKAFNSDDFEEQTFFDHYRRPSLENLRSVFSELSWDDFIRVASRRIPHYHICLPSHPITESSKRNIVLEYWLEVDGTLCWGYLSDAFHECGIELPLPGGIPILKHSFLRPVGATIGSRPFPLQPILKPADAPTLAELKKMPLHDGSSNNMRIIDEVAVRWDEIAIAMDFDPVGHTQTAIDKDFGSVREKSTETFKKWLQGEGSKQPASWEILVEILKDCNFGNLASNIEHLF